MTHKPIKSGATRNEFLKKILFLEEENDTLRERVAVLEAQCAELEKLCLLDPRTGNFGILNPRGFWQKNKEIESLLTRRCKSAFALFVADIDGFKGVNDRLGHDIGDRVISCLAETLNRSTRPTDIRAEVARPGGDEFVVILEINDNFDDEKIASRATEINSYFQKACAKYIRDTPISLSFGLRIFDECSFNIWKSVQKHSDDTPKTFMDEIQKLADLCLLEAKRRGKKRICWKDFDGKFKEKVFE